MPNCTWSPPTPVGTLDTSPNLWPAEPAERRSPGDVSVVLAEGADVNAAYPVAAETLAAAPAPPLVSALVAKLAVPGALVEVSAIAAVVR